MGGKFIVGDVLSMSGKIINSILDCSRIFFVVGVKMGRIYIFDAIFILLYDRILI